MKNGKGRCQGQRFLGVITLRGKGWRGVKGKPEGQN